MIRHRLRSLPAHAAVAVTAVAVAAVALIAAPRASAQGSVGGLGFGYPVGGGSVRTNATGGAFAEFDALTPTNPAALGGLSRTVITVAWATAPARSTNQRKALARVCCFMVKNLSWMSK